MAVVDGKEISEETFEELYEKVLAVPAVAEQLQGTQGEAYEPMLQAQVVSQMLVSEVLFSGAKEDFDIEVGGEEVRARLEEMQDQAGGEDEFGQQIQGMGTTREMLVDQDLPFALMVEQVQEQVAGDEAETTPPPAPPGQQQPPSEAQLAFQEWAQDKLAAASVSVRSQIGVWNPNTGQVQPPGGVSGGPGGQPPPG